MSAVGQFAQRALSQDSKQSSVAVLPNYFFLFRITIYFVNSKGRGSEKVAASNGTA